jgi:RNA polymerase sigma-70 factor (ECF subfamily)
MPYSPTPEELDLVSRLQRGDAEAFECLVRTRAGGLLRCARKLLGNEDDAREAVQDAFLQASRHIGSFQCQCQLSTWLHKIALNAALMKRRARACRPQVSIDDLVPRFVEDGHHADPPAEWQEPVEAALEREETKQLVRASIDLLPDTYRTVLILRELDQLDTEATADALGITPNAVKIRLHRARQALRTLLDPHFRSESRDLSRISRVH